MFIEAKTPYSLSFYFVLWFNTTQILWAIDFFCSLTTQQECIATTFIRIVYLLDEPTRLFLSSYFNQVYDSGLYEREAQPHGLRRH